MITAVLKHQADYNEWFDVFKREMDGYIERGDMELVRANAKALSEIIQKLMDMAGANIHGSATTMDQSEIDNLIG